MTERVERGGGVGRARGVAKVGKHHRGQRDAAALEMRVGKCGILAAD